jgi:DNA-3-methyladenine glycosylase I
LSAIKPSNIRPQPASWGEKVLTHPDGRARCPWAGRDPLYVAYHDAEWGKPERDGRALFEKLILDGFQAGLSWITILRKRDAFRDAFDGFDPLSMACYNDKQVEKLMRNGGIVRNRAKIEGAILSARAWIEIENAEGFSNYLWRFVDYEPVVNTFRRVSETPTQTPLSEKIARDLKKRGFRFCGPTIVYAFMQAVGMVDDHLVDCHCRNRPGGL